MRQKYPKKLRPNCLLTRFPICFVHGLKNIFNVVDYWCGVPEFLRGHGYETHDLKIAWRGPRLKRVADIENHFRRLLLKHDKIHVIAHSMGTLNLVEILKNPEFKGRLSSVTFIAPPFGGTPIAELGEKFGPLSRRWSYFKSTNEALTAAAAQQILAGYQKPEGVLLGSFISRPGPYPITPHLVVQWTLLNQYLKRHHLPAENDGLIPLTSQRIAEGLGPIFKEFPGDHIQIIGSGPWPEHLPSAHEMYLDHAILLAEHDYHTAK